jgi:hypothetical protein
MKNVQYSLVITSSYLQPQEFTLSSGIAAYLKREENAN